MTARPQPLDPEVERRLAAIKPWVDRLPRDRYWVYDVDRKGPSFQDRPFTDARLLAHLKGEARYGLGQMEPGSSTTRAAVIDFDDHSNTLPAGALAQATRDVASTLELLGYHPTVWTSGGGVGAHIYLIWDRPQDAYSVRTFLREVIASCPRQHDILIEVYPKQDRLTSQGKGSRGSMVWLPYNRASTPWTTSAISWVDWRASPDVPYLEPPVRTTNADIERSADLERLREASLAVAHADGDRYGSRNEWRNFVFAIHSATQGSEEGFELADEFSSLVPKYEDSEDVRKLWDSASLDKDNAVGTDLILKRAEQAGWQDPQAFADVADLAEEIPNSPKTRFMAAWEMAEWPAPDWLIDGVLPEKGLGVIYGASGSGKSFAALDMAIAIATGADWRGRRVKQGRVVIIVAEGRGGYGKRLRAIAAVQGVDLRALDRTLTVYPEAPNFLNSDSVRVLEELMAGDVKAHGPAALVIVDTLAQVTPGGNENSSEDMGTAINVSQKLGAIAGGLVKLVHHSGKDESKGARGHSSLRAASDVELEVTKDSDSGVHVIKTTKQKDGDSDMTLGFRLREVETGILDRHGDPETSCVVAAADIVEPVEAVKGKWQQAVARFLMATEGANTLGNIVKAVREDVGPHLDNRGKDRTRGDIVIALRALRDAQTIAIRGDLQDDATEVVALKTLKG